MVVVVSCVAGEPWRAQSDRSLWYYYATVRLQHSLHLIEGDACTAAGKLIIQVN